ncbi:MAG: transcriptional repressor [Actinomycetia bacterium]|nr:transcriptional repressor [Actinomycetes bacterium]
MSDVVIRLRSHGIRMTRQRCVVAEALEALEGFPTVEEVYASAVDRLPDLSRATVYNSLQTFAATGEVRQIGGAGALLRYALADSGVEIFVRCLDGRVLRTDDLDLPIEKVQITYVVRCDHDEAEVAQRSEVPTSPDQVVADLRTSAPVPAPAFGSRARPTDPVYRPRG